MYFFDIIIFDGKGCFCIIYNLSKVLGTLFQVKGKVKFFSVKHGLEVTMFVESITSLTCKKIIIDLHFSLTVPFFLLFVVSVLQFVTQIEGDQSKLFIPY